MAIANYEALNKLLKAGDYNVRVSVCNSDNTTTEVFREVIRDSLGGGIVHSKQQSYFTVRCVDIFGVMHGFSSNICGKKLITELERYINLTHVVGIRFDLVTDKGIRSWVIIR